MYTWITTRSGVSSVPSLSTCSSTMTASSSGDEVRGQGRESERREERVFDRTPERTGGFGQGRKHELDAQGALRSPYLYIVK